MKLHINPMGLGLGLFIASTTASAGGFYLPEVATPGSVGTAGASNPTSTFGAPTVWTNPAAMVRLEEDESLFIGGQFLIPELKFDSNIATGGGSDGGNSSDFAGTPGFFYAKRLNQEWTAGASITALMGGGVDYGNNFVGRYQANKAILTGAALTLSAGYSVNEQLSLGFGVSIVQTTFEEDISVNKNFICPMLCTPEATDTDGEIKLKELDDIGTQGILSLLYEVNDDLAFGVVYRSKLNVDLDGDLETRNLEGTVLNALSQNVGISFDTPELLEVGMRYNLNDNLVLFVAADVEHWSQFSSNYLELDNSGALIEIDRNWHNTWRVAVALGHRKEDRMFTAGISYDSSPVDDEDRTFDLTVDQQVRFAVAYFVQRDQGLNYGFAAEYVSLGDNKIDQTVQGVRVRGEFDTAYMLVLAGTVEFKF